MKHLISLSFRAIIACCMLTFVACDENMVGPEEDDAAAEDIALSKKRENHRRGARLRLAEGEAAIVYTFPDVGGVQTPEGIAFDRRGNMYLSNRIGTGTEWTANRIEKVTPGGHHSIVADLGSSGECPVNNGVLGLTTDPKGDIYAAVASCFPENRGVMKITRHGKVTHLDGSEGMILPNSLTFDSRGNLYVTDSFGGSVWRYGRNKRHGKRMSFELWLTDELLAPDWVGPIPWGANGIAYKAPNDLYVANTAGSWIAHIPILPGGDAGIPEKILPSGPTPWLFLYPDGLTIDTHGMLYTAHPPGGTPPPPGVPDPGIPFSPVVKMDPATGLVTPVIAPIVVGSPESELFDTATSLAFGSSPRDHKSVFVVSGDTFGTPGGSGPVITQVGVGNPGAKGQ